MGLTVELTMLSHCCILIITESSVLDINTWRVLNADCISTDTHCDKPRRRGHFQLDYRQLGQVCNLRR